MRTGVVLLNFGEPERPVMEEVVPFLERIFLMNATLEPGQEEAARKRARELAGRRAPGLIEEYEAIGGSPLHAQARRQAEMLEEELRRRGHDVVVVVGMQFTEPGIPAAVAAAREAGVQALIGLPVYPLCGPSTNVAALADLRRAVDAAGWDVRVHEITGWHVHPEYTALRADGVRALCAAEGVDLADPGTRLVFSAHGTPLRYLREGSRYDLYVDDHCRRLAAALDLDEFVLGFQNHANRPGVEWTRPDIDQAIRGITAERIVVVPVSFMHEQSETLAELDHALKDEAESLGLAFHRVPIPFDDPRFAALLADLLEPFTNGKNPADIGYGQCRCRAVPGTVCLNHRLEREEAPVG
ncbi:MAG TPA: ferrochelatase [Longimicrobiales bacterium]|nr:ferrochelatase [Longimicrobiales bacterium]